MTFDPKKPVQTRDGRYARIICTDAQGEYPIVALVYRIDFNDEAAFSYTRDGRASANANGPRYDLINVPERKTWWANVYDGCVSRTFHSRQDASGSRGADARGLVSLTVEDGKIVLITNYPLGGGDDE